MSRRKRSEKWKVGKVKSAEEVTNPLREKIIQPLGAILDDAEQIS
jgi:hypothetical protein